MRTCLLVVLVLAACKDKQEAKPQPPAPAPAPAVKPEPATPEPATPEPATPSAATKPPIKPAGGINTAAEYEAKAFDLMDKITAVFSGAGTNCEKLANGLEGFLDANKDAITSTEVFQKANPSAEDDLEPKLQSRAKLFMEKVTLSLQACQNHAGVKAALAKLPD